VSEVALKFKLAQTQLDQWTRLGAKVQFLVPQANQSEVEKNHYCLLISDLEQAAAVLPDITQNQPSPSVKSKMLVSANSRYIIVFSATLLVFIIFFGFYSFTSTESSKHQSVAENSNISKVAPVQKTHLVAVYKQDKTCAQTSSQDISLRNQTFADLALKQLCELYLQTPLSQLQILLVAQDAYTVLPLTQTPQGWQIPLPKNRLSNRHYYLVSLAQALNEEKIEQLRLYRETMPKPEMLTGKSIADWLDTQEVESTIYSHKLVIE
jgi:hypothetical protein